MFDFRSGDADKRRHSAFDWPVVLLIAALTASVVASLPAEPLFANPQGGAVLPASGPWTSRDYVRAIFAVHNGDMTLPRRGNPKTQAFFDRLIDRGNIETLMASRLTPAEKRRDILIILSATGEFRGRYGYAVALGDDVQDELVQIQIFRLYLIDRLAALGIRDDETGCMLEQTDRKLCASAIATTLSGTLDTLAEAHIFPNDRLVALSTAFTEHYPAIRTKLSAEERLRIATRLQGMAVAESDPALKTALTAALLQARHGN